MTVNIQNLKAMYVWVAKIPEFQGFSSLAGKVPATNAETLF